MPLRQKEVLPQYIIHQFNVQFLPRLIKGIDGCFPTALGRQLTFSNILGPSVCICNVLCNKILEKNDLLSNNSSAG